MIQRFITLLTRQNVIFTAEFTGSYVFEAVKPDKYLFLRGCPDLLEENGKSFIMNKTMGK